MNVTTTQSAEVKAKWQMANAKRQERIRKVESLVRDGKEDEAAQLLCERPVTITINNREVDDRGDERLGFFDLARRQRQDGTEFFSFTGLYSRFVATTEEKLSNIDEDLLIQEEFLDEDSPHVADLERRRDNVERHLLTLKKTLLLMEKEVASRKESYALKFREQKAEARKAEIAKVNADLAKVQQPVRVPAKPQTKWITDKVINKAEAIVMVGGEDKLTECRKDSKIYSTNTLMVLSAESRLVVRKNGAATQYALEKRVAA